MAASGMLPFAALWLALSSASAAPSSGAAPGGPAAAASALPEVAQLICEFAEKGDIEERAVDKVCARIAEGAPWLKLDPSCAAVVGSLWDEAVLLCQHGKTYGVTPEEVEELICDFATQKVIEEKAVGQVCALITEKFPSVKLGSNCTEVMESVWEEAAASCPRRSGAAPPFTGEEAGRLVCSAASRRDVRRMAVGKVCRAFKQRIQLGADCTELLDSLWEEAASACPEQQRAAVSVAITPEDVEEMICEFATQRQIELKAVGEVCMVITQRFPSITFDPNCTVMMEALWDKAVTACPTGLPPVHV